MATLPGTRPGPSRGRTPAPAAPGVLPGAGSGRVIPQAPAQEGVAARRRARAQELAQRALPRGRGVIRKRFSRLTIMSVLLLAVAAVGLVQVLQTSRIANIGYDVRALEIERQSLSAQIRVLEAQIAASTNLDQMRTEAIDRLGMVPADKRVRVTVDVPAPDTVPLPRRYVPDQVHEEPAAPAWWERLIGRLPGAS